jgi:hypothetical protein
MARESRIRNSMQKYQSQQLTRKEKKKKPPIKLKISPIRNLTVQNRVLDNTGALPAFQCSTPWYLPSLASPSFLAYAQSAV